MRTTRRITRCLVFARVLAAACLLAQPLAAPAQDSGTTPMDMQGMSMIESTPPAEPPAKKKDEAKQPSKPKAADVTPPPASPDAMQNVQHDTGPGLDHDAMPTMQHEARPAARNDAMPGMDHASMPGMNSMSDMQMGAMQGGGPPPDARNPDYSDGIGYGPMTGMDMDDNASHGMLMIDQLEAFNGSDANGQSWDAEGWYGNDVDKFWLRTEGERSGGTLEDADIEALWNRNIATFWSSQIGARHDFGRGPPRDWAAFGVQGLAPYWFELEATAYLGTYGRTAARLRAEYELNLTQRLILQPDAEVNLYGRDDPARRIGSGLSDMQFGLRLRYEFRREIAPYIGLDWTRQLGTTARYARMDAQPVLDRRIMAGVRIWF